MVRLTWIAHERSAATTRWSAVGDGMSWVKLDDAVALHPKVHALGLEAFGLWVAGLCYANRTLSDGVIPLRDLCLVYAGVHWRSLRRLCDRIEAAGLWHKEAHGYRIHDYHDYQPSAEEIRKLRVVRAQSGRRGGKASGEARAKQVASPWLEANANPVPVPTPVVAPSEVEPPQEVSRDGRREEAPSRGSRNGFQTEAREVLAFLNARTGRTFQPLPANLDLIRARLKQGASVSQCRAVIAVKVRQWAGDEQMARYLRPGTLFNTTKFAQYLGELPATAFQATQEPTA